MTTVMLVDDQALVRAGLRALLEASEDIEISDEAPNGREALRLARAHKPDVFLMDLRMPVMDGIETTRAIRADPLLREVPVLVLTTFDDDEDVLEAIRAGATGYLLKDIDAGELRRAVRASAEGHAQLAPSVARGIMERLSRLPGPADVDPRVARLTEREVEVLAHVGLGLSNDEIGKSLFISPETARTYVSRLLGKLGARDRSQLVVIAHRAGLVASDQ